LSQPLFSTKGRRALKRLRPGALLALDFDGTLVPIADHAEDAYLDKPTAQLLRELGRLTPLAILSGRGRRDLRARLGFQPKFLIGNHGLESPGHEREAREAARLTKAWAAQLKGAAGIENKTFSLSLHYRLAPNRARARARWLREIAKLQPAPRVIGGKCVFNLMPEGGVDKGRALQGLIRRTSAAQVLFIGDDDTDEEAFKLKDRRLLTVRVGRRKNSQAQFFIRRQEDVLKLLTQLKRMLSLPDISCP
jgi:trehalose 6-phosphate phosphatase